MPSSEPNRIDIVAADAERGYLKKNAAQAVGGFRVTRAAGRCV
jgi:hypothetical protein